MDIREKLKAYGQEHLIKFEDELSEEQKKNLYASLEEIDFDVVKLVENRKAPAKRGVISPIFSLDLSMIEKKHDEYEKAGIEAIKAGKVGAVLLAGGMGTRLGSNDPKGMYNVGLTRDLYIFECLINNLMDSVNKCGAYIPLYVMTSDLNHESTVAFFEEKKYFGYPSEYVTFFKQAMAPCCSYDGKIFLERKDKVAVSPNGNGGWFLSMMNNGILDKAKASGIEWFNIFAVDNVCQRICDPVFIGATILEKKNVGAKVVRKASRDEKVGVLCLEDGKPSIVDYYELSEEMMDETDERGERVYNFGVILNYLFNVADLEKIVKYKLPYHVVEKKIQHIDENGEEVHPEAPNGCKFEQLVLDMIYLSGSCLPFEVVRDYEFAPIKNKTGVDSVESARALLVKNGVKL